VFAGSWWNMGQSSVSGWSADSSEAPVDRMVIEKAEARSTIVKIMVIAFFFIVSYPLGILAEVDSGRGKTCG
jgi:hypothetical protein